MILSWIKGIVLIALIWTCIAMVFEGQKRKPNFMPYGVSVIAEIFFLSGILLGEIVR